MSEAAVTRGSRGQQGMTLIEVLAAAGMFVVIFAAITGLIGSTRRLQSAVQEHETAMFHLEGVAERISSAVFAGIPVTFPADGTDVTAATGVVRTLPAELITITYTGWDWATWVVAGSDVDAIPDPLTIRIQTTWNDMEGGAPQTETLVIVRSNSI